MLYTHLTHRGLLRISGEDTVPFLQGLVSNDVARLGQRPALYAALLTPQGKFLHDFFLVREGDAVWLDSDASRLPDLAQKMKMYRLRSKVSIDPAPEGMGVAAMWNADDLSPVQASLAFPDPRLPLLGWRVIGNKASVDAALRARGGQEVKPEEYERLRLEAGVPEGGHDLIPEKSFLLPFGFEDLHGVDFKKGCYVGQEVTARSKHLGQLRKFIYKVESADKPLPPAGTPVYAGEALMGEMRSSLGTKGLAFLEVQAVRDARAQGVQLRAAEVSCFASLPAWVTAEFPAL